MEEEKKIQADISGAGEGTAKLSKAQKKKIKDKEKAVQLAKEEEDLKAKGEPVAAKEDGKNKKKAGGKPISKQAQIIQEKLAEKKRLEDEANAEFEKIKQEEERLEKEKQEEQNAILKEQREKKQQEKDKINKLKAEGKYLTPSQLKKERARQIIINERIAAGEVISEDEAEGGKKKSTMIRDKKNKNKKKQQEEEKEAPKVEEVKEKQPKESKKVEVKKVVEEEEKQGKAEDEESAPEDWDNEDEDEMINKFNKKPESEALASGQYDEDNNLKQQNKAKSGEAAQTQKKGPVVKGEKQQDLALFTDGYSVDDKAIREQKRKEELKKKIADRKANASKKVQKMRCPIVCILGHVDTGKTLILDKLRKTNVQAGEAGGITQQIGATYFPRDYIEGHIEKLNKKIDIELNLPGFLVIDTPGHESFTNLRSRGSSLCDIAILVVDLMHGLEQQTLESIELLRQKKCPFIIALNKIDRCYQWESIEYENVRDALDRQSDITIQQYKSQMDKAILAFAEEGFNALPYWDNPDIYEYVSLVPTSAITGEGLPDLITYLSLMCQQKIPKQLYEREEFECTVLEVKVIEGLGTTIDVVLLNGLIKVQDTIVLQGFNGPIVTQVRALLTPYPLKEMRVKGEYVHHQKIKGAMGIKISAPNLENALAGSELLKANNDAEIKDAVAEIQDNMYDIMDKYVDKTADGVCVQASTLGSLEALLEFLKTSKIPVCSISIGPVHKKDVQKASKVLAKEEVHKIKKEYACILAFDVRVTPEAEKFADQEGVKVFTANIIYHLFDEFTAYVKECEDKRKSTGGNAAIFPCTLEILKDFVFNRQDPIIVGVNVTAGCLRIGTPLCLPEKENLKIGVVETIEKDKKPRTKVYPKDGSVAIRISGAPNVAFGRHFDETNQVASQISRRSLDSLKEFYRDEMTSEDWKLCVQLKKTFNIQ